MKRLLCIAAALFIATLFALPTAAIANLDGTEPVFNGEAGIVPLNDSVEFIGDPDAPADEVPADGSIDRSSLARSESPSIQSYAALSLVVFTALGLLSLAALSLSVIALVKVNKVKAAADSISA